MHMKYHLTRLWPSSSTTAEYLEPTCVSAPVWQDKLFCYFRIFPVNAIKHGKHDIGDHYPQWFTQLRRIHAEIMLSNYLDDSRQIGVRIKTLETTLKHDTRPRDPNLPPSFLKSTTSLDWQDLNKMPTCRLKCLHDELIIENKRRWLENGLSTL